MRLRLHEVVVAHTLEAPAQRGQGILALPGVLGQRLQTGYLLAGIRVEAAVGVHPVVVQEIRQPRLAELAVERVDRTHLRLGEVQDARQHLQIFRLDLVVADIHSVVGVRAAAPRRLVVQGEDADLAGEDLLQPFHLTAQILARTCPAILVVHVEDQVDGHALLDDAGQQQPR